MNQENIALHEAIARAHRVVDEQRQLSNGSMTEEVALKQKNDLSTALTLKAISETFAAPPSAADAMNDNQARSVAYLMERQAEKMVHPHKTSQAKSNAFWTALEKDGGYSDQCMATPEMMRIFRDQAKAGKLTTTEAMVGQYLCYMNPSSDLRRAQCLFHLIFTALPQHRVLHHNWMVMTQYPEAVQNEWGPAIQDLRFPLFPKGELDQLNLSIIKAAQEVNVSGAGPEQKAKHQKDMTKLFNMEGDRQMDIFSGGDYAEYMYDTTGAPVGQLAMKGTDERLTFINGEVHNLNGGVQHLQAQIQELSKQNARLLAQIKPALAQQAYNKQPSRGSAQNSQGRGYGGPGGRGNRGGYNNNYSRGYHGAGDGEEHPHAKN